MTPVCIIYHGAGVNVGEYIICMIVSRVVPVGVIDSTVGYLELDVV